MNQTWRTFTSLLKASTRLESFWTVMQIPSIVVDIFSTRTVKSSTRFDMLSTRIEMSPTRHIVDEF